MRIVYVSWEFPPQIGGGIGTYVHAVSRILAARGHEVAVVTVGREAFPTREVADGVTVIRLPGVEPRGGGPLDVLRNWRDRSRAVADVLGKLQRSGVDLIEFPDFRGEGVAYLSETVAGRRPVCVLRLHAPLAVVNAYNPGRTRHEVLEQYELTAIAKADRVVSPSRAVAIELQRRLGPVVVDASPHPVDPDFLAAGVGAPPAGLVAGNDVLYVGRVEPIKGSETLVRAAVRMLHECPGSRLVMLGGDTERSAREPSMRAVLGGIVPRDLSDRLTFREPVARGVLVEAIRQARFCALPSHFDNFPNTCLEAMALGAVVVAGANSGMAEMIEDGVSGVLVPSGDVDALAAALVRVWNMTPEQRRRIGTAAHRRIEERYSPGVVGAEIERLYDGYLRGHGTVEPRPAVAPAPRRLSPPRVSVVVPCYNQGAFLAEALASVRAQTWPHVECVVVDDGSTDAVTLAALDAARRDGVRVLSQPNAGLAAARNAGIRATDAPYVVPLDADDAIEPGFVEALLGPLDSDASLGFAYGHVRFFGAAQGGWECPPYDPRRLLYENLTVATALLRRRAFEEAGGYREDMVYGYEDWDLWLAMLSLGWRGCCVPQPLFRYRKHPGGSMLSRMADRRAEMVRRMVEHHPRLFAAIAGPGRSSEPEELDPILGRLALEAELSHIENSRLWRLVRSLRLAPAEQSAATEPANRLARIKASIPYRMIRAFKRLPVYRWYARRRYGPDFTP